MTREDVGVVVDVSESVKCMLMLGEADKTITSTLALASFIHIPQVPHNSGL